jgi:DNA mismatch repair protein MutH
MGDWGREVQEERVGAVGPAVVPELEALLAHARALIGVELAELADQLGLPEPVGAEAARRSKGWSGQVIERELGVETAGGSGPDFAALGTELKTVPVDERLNPRESTAVCQIDPVTIAGESWDTSTARKKLARVLFVALEVPAGARSVGQRRVTAVRLWSPTRAEDTLLRADFELFARDYFRRGRSSAITGHLGQVLQVRPKGRNAADLRDGYDEFGQPTRVGKCGFYLRASFVAAILRDGR